ncbi:unnamed protein product, partial [Mesorhabditis spiculigera]
MTNGDAESARSMSIYTLQRSATNVSRRIAVSARTNSESTTAVTPPTVFPEKCSCRYLWRKELHGLSQLMMSHSLEMRLFWLLVLLGCFGAAIWNAQYILGAYVNMKREIGGHTQVAYRDLMKYMLAGSGFDYVNVQNFSDSYTRTLQLNLDIWQANRTTQQLFDFVFKKNSINCSEFFKQCTQGARDVNCCDIFEPTYVMLRGRCFKLKSYEQKDADELAKLRLFINNIPSPIVADGWQPNLIMYLGDENPETSTFPRYYLNLNSWNKFRFSLRLLISLPDNPRCSTSTRNQGFYTCYVYTWVHSLVEKYGCALPYYKETLDYLWNVPVCDVATVVANYSDIKWPRLERFKCLPACSRREISIDWTSAPNNAIDASAYGYRLEAAFNELQVSTHQRKHRQF